MSGDCQKYFLYKSTCGNPQETRNNMLQFWLPAEKYNEKSPKILHTRPINYITSCLGPLGPSHRTSHDSAKYHHYFLIFSLFDPSKLTQRLHPSSSSDLSNPHLITWEDISTATDFVYIRTCVSVENESSFTPPVCVCKV